MDLLGGKLRSLANVTHIENQSVSPVLSVLMDEFIQTLLSPSDCCYFDPSFDQTVCHSSTNSGAGSDEQNMLVRESRHSSSFCC